MKKTLTKDANNGSYHFKKGDEVEFRQCKDKSRIEIRITFKEKRPICAIWSEFDKDIIN